MIYKSKDDIEIILLSYFKLLLRYTTRVIFIQDNPYLYFNPVEEIQNGKNIFIIGLNASRVFINLFNPQITVLDPFSLFCPNRICKYFNKNLSLFLDNNHLNGVFIKNRVIE